VTRSIFMILLTIFIILLVILKILLVIFMILSDIINIVCFSPCQLLYMHGKFHNFSNLLNIFLMHY
jgi:hypothetical protein